MSIIIGKITNIIYDSESFSVFSFRHGKKSSIVVFNGQAPKKLKTMEYQISGEYINHSKYGKRLNAEYIQKISPVQIYKKTMTDYLASRL